MQVRSGQVSSSEKHLWLQPGTRLHMVVQRQDEMQSDGWGNFDGWTHFFEVWTSTDKRTGDSSTWHGTFLRLHPDGRIEQVHRDPHGVETAFDVMD